MWHYTEPRDGKPSNVLKLRHLSDKNEIAVVFRSSQHVAYHYEGQSKETFDKILASESIGSAVHALLIKPKVPFSKQENTEPPEVGIDHS